MLELSIAISIIILAVYIKKKNLKPSKEYIGNESGLVNRAREVIYYNTLKNITALIFPLILALTYFTEFLNIIEKLYNDNYLRFALFTIIISIITILISKVFTKIAVKRAIKKDNLRKYIGGIWIDTSLEDVN